MAHYTPEQIRTFLSNFRAPDRACYPELAEYTRDEIYEDFFGGGGLYLAAQGCGFTRSCWRVTAMACWRSICAGMAPAPAA